MQEARSLKTVWLACSLVIAAAAELRLGPSDQLK
jgi:hypothetical protein